MPGIVHPRPPQLDSPEELVQADPEPVGEDRQGRDGRDRVAELDRRYEGGGERLAELALGQAAGHPPQSQLGPDRLRQGGALRVVREFRNT
jgi:hypothetical protein